MQRTDRVYALCLSADGAHMAIGGRDKRVALFDMRGVKKRKDKGTGGSGTGAAEDGGGSGGSARVDTMLWEVVADDFVYTLVLSSDLRYCAFGGTAQRVTLLEGHTGAHLYDITCEGVVWSLSLLDGTSATQRPVAEKAAEQQSVVGSSYVSADDAAETQRLTLTAQGRSAANRCGSSTDVLTSTGKISVSRRVNDGVSLSEPLLAIGGDSGKLSVYLVASREAVSRCPSTTSSTASAPHESIVYANGRRAAMFGNGGGRTGGSTSRRTKWSPHCSLRWSRRRSGSVAR